MMALLIANTAVTISEFAGIASGLALFGAPEDRFRAAGGAAGVDAYHVG